MDVLCVLDGTYAIVIEDKTHTEAHSNQLAKYLTDIKGRGYQPENILAMYFKTGDQSCYTAIY
ncbi:PD-(D/E)XK nuclease family protein [Vreelandella venusta]